MASSSSWASCLSFTVARKSIISRRTPFFLPLPTSTGKPFEDTMVERQTATALPSDTAAPTVFVPGGRRRVKVRLAEVVGSVPGTWFVTTGRPFTFQITVNASPSASATAAVIVKEPSRFVLAGGEHTAVGGWLADKLPLLMKSEERRVGKECRSRWAPYH